LVPPRLALLSARSYGTAAFVEREDRHGGRFGAARGKPCVEGLRILADGAQVVHGRGLSRRARGLSSGERRGMEPPVRQSVCFATRARRQRPPRTRRKGRS